MAGKDFLNFGTSSQTVIGIYAYLLWYSFTEAHTHTHNHFMAIIQVNMC